MSKAEDIARVSVKGSFHLLWGLIISTVISSVGTIFIARLLGSDLYGLYTIVLVVPAFIIIFRDWGINSAMVRFTAQYRAEGRIDELRSIFLTGIIFEITVGLLLSLFSFVFADSLASLFNRPDIGPLIQIASISILASGLITATTSIFTGYERLELNSIMLIAQSIFKTAIIIALVFLGLGTAGAVIGYTAGVLAAGVIGLALIWAIYRQLPKGTSHKLEIRAYLSAMLSYAIPLSFATIISALLSQFYAFLLPIHYVADNVPIGNYGVALTFSVLITFFAYPITTVLFPAFSKLNPQKDSGVLRNVFQFSVKYASLFVVPVTALVMSLSVPAVETLFGTTYQSAPLYLALFSINFLLTAFGSVSLSALLNGQGKTNFTLKMTVLTCSIGFPLGFLLIMTFGVIGLIISTLTAGIPSFIWGLRFINKTYGISVDWHSSLRILASSGIAGIVTYIFVSLLNFPSLIELLLGIVLFVSVFVPAALLTKSVMRVDIVNLRGMISGFGVVEKLLGRVLDGLEKLMSIFKL